MASNAQEWSAGIRLNPSDRGDGFHYTSQLPVLVILRMIARDSSTARLTVTPVTHTFDSKRITRRFTPRFSLFRHAKKRLKSRLRQLATLATVAALSACAVGIPLPDSVKKPSDVAYPCQDCPCGCKTAEVCWTNCCCFTQAEKIAWARDNNVTPPAYVLTALNNLKAPSKSCCCSKQSTCSEPTVAESKIDAPASNQVCEAGEPSQKSCSARPQKHRSEFSILLTVQAQRCQGLTSSLTSLPPSVMPLLDACPFADPIASRFTVINDLFSPGPIPVPDTPPPQFI